jgi:NAD(P)-dependent dehydrogenase (short-subunit alcohol dehydrogenase family)
VSVAWIIGAGSGVGRATAQALAADGWVTALSGRAESTLIETGSLFPESDWIALPGDGSDPLFAEEAVGTIVDRYGRIDALIYTAGVGLYGTVEHYPLDDWDETFRSNVTGLFVTARAALPRLKASRGSVIAIGSGASLQGYASLSAYAASKFALRGFMQSLAAEVSRDGVKCSLILPGSIRTGFAGRDPDAPPSDPTKKWLVPGDVADAICFLLKQPAHAWTQEMTLWPF